MKIGKFILSVVFGRIIHAGVKAAFPLTTNNPNTAFLLAGAAAAVSMFLGFAIVFGLSGYLRKRSKTTEANASGQDSINN